MKEPYKQTEGYAVHCDQTIKVGSIVIMSKEGYQRYGEATRQCFEPCPVYHVGSFGWYKVDLGALGTNAYREQQVVVLEEII